MQQRQRQEDILSLLSFHILDSVNCHTVCAVNTILILFQFTRGQDLSHPVPFPRLNTDCNNMRCKRYSCHNFKKWISCHPREKPSSSSSCLVLAVLRVLPIWLCSNWAATARFYLFILISFSHSPFEPFKFMLNPHYNALPLSHLLPNLSSSSSSSSSSSFSSWATIFRLNFASHSVCLLRLLCFPSLYCLFSFPFHFSFRFVCPFEKCTLHFFYFSYSFSFLNSIADCHNPQQSHPFATPALRLITSLPFSSLMFPFPTVCPFPCRQIMV